MPSVEPEIADDASFLVYADQLLLAGDPRGELIHLDHALAQRHRLELVIARKALLARHPELMPGRAITSRVQLDWHLGFVRTLAVQDVGLLAELFAHPSLRFVERLIVTGYAISQAQIDQLDGVLPAGLSSLALGEPWSMFRIEHQALQVDGLLEHPLRELETRIPIELTRAAPSLRSFTTTVSTVAPKLEHMPNLERVMVFGSATPIDLREVLARPLVEFGAVYVPIDADAIELLAKMSSLQRLRLWNAGLTGHMARDLRERFGDRIELRDDLEL